VGVADLTCARSAVRHLVFFVQLVDRLRRFGRVSGLAVRMCAVAVVLSLGIAARAFLHRSLDRSGAIAGFLVMAIHIAAGYRFAALLLVFFFTSSKLTKMGEEKKRSIEEDFKEGGQRNW
ncbi:hypothetical protein BHM03_00061321, partial [Ensete ventricosum]